MKENENSSATGGSLKPKIRRISQADIDAAKAEFLNNGGNIDKLPPQQIDDDFNPAQVSVSAKKSGRIGIGFQIAKF